MNGMSIPLRELRFAYVVSLESKTSSSGILVVLAYVAVGVAEHARLGVLDQESQEALLPTAALGDVVFLDEGILAVERYGVEVKVEGDAALEAKLGCPIEPELHELRVRSGVDAAAVLGKEGALGDGIQAGKEGQAFVHDVAHDVTVPAAAEKLQAEQGPYSAVSWDHLGAWEIGSLHDASQSDLHQVRYEEKEPAEVGAKGPRAKVQSIDVGLIGASRQPCESFLLQDGRDGDGTEGLSCMCQLLVDVVDGKVLFPEGNDLLAQRIGLSGGTWTLLRVKEEHAFRVEPELVAEHTETAGSVAEPAGSFSGPGVLDEVGSKSFVLSVGSVLGGKEGLGQIC
jgi:hypothetical protein